MAQTANIDKGCVPLTVQFEAPLQAAYFWDFGDGDSSDKQNPEHIYVTPGDFVATLFESEGGTIIGTVAIKVYEDLDITFIPSKAEGCSPSIVDFTSEIVKHPDINIESYNWSFGDGQSALTKDASNEYKTSGSFTVSLEVTTSIGECNRTVRIEDFIYIEELTTFFKPDKVESCDVPAKFFFENLSDNDPSFTYNWDFGNGEVSNAYRPDSIQYSESGTYEVNLTVDNGNLCNKTYTQIIFVGTQIASEFEFRDSICVGDEVRLNALVDRETYEWTLIDANNPNGEIDTIIGNNRSFRFEANKFGTYELQLITTNDEGCEYITSRTLDLNYSAEFTITPPESCQKNTEITLTAENQNYQSYVWNQSGPSGPQTNVNIEVPERDSLFINQTEEINQSLIITTFEGCTDTITKPFISNRPEAYFIPDARIGYAPMTVTFSDFSRSTEEIIHSGWNYGDGQYEEHVGEFQHQHTYVDSGTYCVVLDIENIVGCIDTSINVCITVIEPDGFGGSGGTIPLDITSNVGLPEVGEVIDLCAGTTLVLNTPYDERSKTKIHFEGDGGRLEFCWELGRAIYEFETPGNYPLIATLERGNLIIDTIEYGSYQILGTRSEFWYDYDCSDIKKVEFYDETENADKWSWFVDGILISNEKDFIYSFPDFGEYEVSLETEDTSTGCPPHQSTIDIVIADTKADFAIPPKACANELSFFNARRSDVYEDCCKAKYTWIFEDLPRRKVRKDTMSQILNPGIQDVTLIVEDAMGCPDTITKTVDVYEVISNFVIDSLTCLPASLMFQNTTQSTVDIDTYDWSFGSQEENPTFAFSDEDAMNDSLLVSLIAIDQIGCVDTLEKLISIYDLEPSISIDNNPNICVGETVNFEGQIIDLKDQNVSINWSADQLTTQEGPSWSVDFDESGIYFIEMNYSLENGDCPGLLLDTITVVNQPIAEMSTSVDGESPICFPKIIEFSNESQTDGPTLITWVFDDDEKIRNNDNPTFSFDKGKHKVDLIVKSFYGCADTVSQEFELVFPEGSFDIDVVDLCFGDEFTVQLNNDTVDIYEYVWDMGDGTIITNQNPVTHTYQFNPNGNRASVDLILKAAEEGCEIVESIPINIFEVLPSFEIDDSQFSCNQAQLINTSLGGDIFEWFLNGELISEAMNPIIEFPSPITEQEVTLVISDDDSGCISDTTITVGLNVLEINAGIEIDSLNSNCNQIQLINASMGGDLIEWYIEDELVSQEADFTITFPNDIGEQVVQLVVIDEATGCTSDTTITVSINNQIDYEIDYPNIFSPNGDMVNDYFKADIDTDNPNNVQINTFQIYNRWGNLIYDNDDPQGWDGRYKGEPVPSDVYAYFIEVVIGGCKTEVKKGNVTVVR